jgi:hypothetical protein
MVGRTQKENIYLLKNSSKDDYWFHIKDITSSALQQQSEITKFLINKEMNLKNSEIDKIKMVSKKVKEHQQITKEIDNKNSFLDDIQECGENIKRLIKDAKELDKLKYKKNFVIPLLKSLNNQQKKIKKLLDSEIEYFNSESQKVEKQKDILDDNSQYINDIQSNEYYYKDILSLNNRTKKIKGDILNLYDLKYNSKFKDDIDSLKHSIEVQIEKTSQLLTKEENIELNDKKVIYDLTFHFNSMFKEINYQDFYGLKDINDKIVEFDNKINSLNLKYDDGLNSLKDITQDKLIFINSNVLSLLKYSFESLENELTVDIDSNGLEKIFDDLNVIVGYINDFPKNKYTNNADDIKEFFERVNDFYIKSNLLRISGNIDDLHMFCNDISVLSSNDSKELFNEALILKDIVKRVNTSNYNNDFKNLQTNSISRLDNILKDIKTFNIMDKFISDTSDFKTFINIIEEEIQEKQKGTSKSDNSLITEEAKKVLETIADGEDIDEKDNFSIDDFLNGDMSSSDLKNLSKILPKTNKAIEIKKEKDAKKEYKKVKIKPEVVQKDIEKEIKETTTIEEVSALSSSSQPSFDNEETVQTINIVKGDISKNNHKEELQQNSYQNNSTETKKPSQISKIFTSIKNIFSRLLPF